MDIQMHAFRDGVEQPAVLRGFVWQPVYLFRGRPAYVSNSIRVRNPRGGMMTRMVVMFADDQGGGDSVSATEWAKHAKPLLEMIGEDA